MTNIVAALSFAYTALAGAPQQRRFEVVETARTSGELSSPFGTIGGMVEAAPGIIVVADDIQKALHRWEPRTGKVSRLAREGRGPGEVRAPVSLARRPGGGFVLYDVLNGLLFFDAELTANRSVPLQGGLVSNPKSIAVLADSSVVIAGGRIRDPRHLHRYSINGEWLESFGEPSPGIASNGTKVQAAGGALQSLSPGLLFSFGAPLRIVRFPDNSLSTHQLVAEDPTFHPAHTDDRLLGPPDPEAGGTRQFQWWHDRSTGVFQLDDGRILNVITRFYRGNSVWDLYDAEGRHLGRSVVPRAYYAWDLSSSGDIIASYRDPDTDEHIAVLLQLRAR